MNYHSEELRDFKEGDRLLVLLEIQIEDPACPQLPNAYVSYQLEGGVKQITRMPGSAEVVGHAPEIVGVPDLA